MIGNKFIIVIIFLSLLTNCFGSNRNRYHSNNTDSCSFYYDSILKKDIYIYADKFPEYFGGFKKLNEFIINNFSMKEQEYTQMSFKVTVVIDTNGKIVYQEISGKNAGLTELEREMLRVISIMPNWNPAECKNINVFFRLTIPIYW